MLVRALCLIVVVILKSRTRSTQELFTHNQVQLGCDTTRELKWYVGSSH